MSLVRRSSRLARMGRGSYLAPYIRPTLALARRAATATWKRKMANRSSASADSGSSAPITGEYDYKTDYRRRRIGKRRRRVMRRRRKWKRSVVRAVRDATIGSSHIIRRSFAPDIASAIDESKSISFTMYGLNGTNDPNENTCNDIGQSMYEAVGSADWSNWDSAVFGSRNHKIQSLHGTMEVTMVNTGESDALVEVYHIYARRRVENTYLNPNHIYNTGFIKQDRATEPDTGNIVGVGLTPVELGVTPFQNALFCRNFTITKRQKFRIPAGGEVSFVKKDSRSRIFSLAGTKPFAWDRSLSGILVQFQGVPLGGAVPQSATATKMSFSVIRRYRFKFMRDDLTTDGRN